MDDKKRMEENFRRYDELLCAEAKREIIKLKLLERIATALEKLEKICGNWTQDQ